MSRPTSNYYSGSLRGSTIPPRQFSARNSSRLGAPNSTEQVEYEGNLRRFYQQSAGENLNAERDRQNMLNQMRLEMAALRRTNPNLRPFNSTIRPAYQTNLEQRETGEALRESLIEQRNVGRSRTAYPIGQRPVLIPQTSFVEPRFEGQTFNDDSDLYSQRDDQWREKYRGLQSRKTIGSGVDNSYAIRQRQMQPMVQRSPALRDTMNRQLASGQLRNASELRYYTDRSQRVRERPEMAAQWSTIGRTEPFPPIGEVSANKEKWWDYDFDALD